MPYDVIIKDLALSEIKEAFEWYQEQKADLGYEFIDEIDACYEKLILDPERYSFLSNRYRRIKTNRFPYLLLYRIKDKQVIVLRVRHIKMKPL